MDNGNSICDRGSRFNLLNPLLKFDAISSIHSKQVCISHFMNGINITLFSLSQGNNQSWEFYTRQIQPKNETQHETFFLHRCIKISEQRRHFTKSSTNISHSIRYAKYFE